MESKPAVQSIVTMPLKDVKSREAAITELKGSEKQEVAKRNRRMFGVLLGTLQKFKKDEEKHSFKDQEKKQKEIETRLEDDKRKERVQMEKERQIMLEKRRRQEQELRRSQWKRALIAATDNQVAQFKRLQNFIQTNTKPPIYFMPAKHSIRTIELQKKSQKRLDELIKQKQEETEAQLKKMDDGLASSIDVDDDEQDTFNGEPPPKRRAIDRIESQKSEIVVSIKEELSIEGKPPIDFSTVHQESSAETSSLTLDATAISDEKSEDYQQPSQPQQPQEPPKPKDIHEELKELTAGYAEELNFEDDDQQR